MGKGSGIWRHQNWVGGVGYPKICTPRLPRGRNEGRKEGAGELGEGEKGLGGAKLEEEFPGTWGLLWDFLECSVEPDKERCCSTPELLQVSAKQLLGKQRRHGEVFL